jgi:hypothetical protein
MGLSVAARAY